MPVCFYTPAEAVEPVTFRLFYTFSTLVLHFKSVKQV